MPGTAYVLFHHVMGEAGGAQRRVGLRARRHGRDHAGVGRGRPRPRRRHPLRRRGGTHPRARRPGRRRRAGRRRRVLRAGRGQQRRRPRDVSEPARPRRAPAGVRGRRRADQLRQRLAEDQRRAGRAAELPGAAGHGAGPPASRHDPHLSGPGLHRARLRRRQVRPALRGAGARVHDSLGGRPDGRAARPSSDVDVRAVRAVRPSRWLLGRPARSFRRSLLRPAGRVRAELQAIGDRTARC